MSHSLLFAFDDTYLNPGLVALTSALANTPDDMLAIVASDRPSDAFRERISDLGGGRTEVVDLSRELGTLPSGEGPVDWPRIVWARVFVQRFLPDHVQRVLYLDADMLIRHPLDRLIGVDLRSRTIGACLDRIATFAQRGDDLWSAVDAHPSIAYFNSGMLLIDLEAWRAKNSESKVLRFAFGEPLKWPDQDALNLALWDDWYPLPGHLWNFHSRDDLVGSAHAAIVHFTGAKPWEKRIRNPMFQSEYLDAAREIGWNIRLGVSSTLTGYLRHLTPAGLLERRQYREARRYPGLTDLA